MDVKIMVKGKIQGVRAECPICNVTGVRRYDFLIVSNPSATSKLWICRKCLNTPKHTNKNLGTIGV